ERAERPPISYLSRVDPVRREIERLLAWRRGEAPGPLRLHLVLTERCNLTCRSCFMGQLPPRTRDQELDDATLERVVDQAIELGVEELYLVGGEILVRPEIALSVMTRVKEAGLRGDLTTNGTRLDDGVVQRLVDMGWDRVQVSLDGPDPASNDALRPPAGSFERTVAGVRRLVRARGGAPTPEIGLTTVVSADNWRQLPAMVDLAAELGASEATFQALKDMSPECEAMGLDRSALAGLADVVAAAIERAGHHGLATNAGDLLQPALVDDRGLDEALRDDVDRLDDPLFAAHCYLPWTTMVVHFDGRVSPCWEWRGDELGNVREVPLGEIWQGEVFGRWRQDFLAGRMPDHCRQCCLGFVDHIRWVRLEGLLAAADHAQALAFADQLLAWQPAHRHAAVARAKALLGLGRGDDAEAWVRECLDRRVPDRSLERAYLIDVLFDGDRRAAAVELADSLLADAPRTGPVAAAARRLARKLGS
ncbi:MAG: radical SAM protein, partial [Myxococcota bacterium]|nr:radical SAM protein [Myxococcota bacterium]